MLSLKVVIHHHRDMLLSNLVMEHQLGVILLLKVAIHHPKLAMHHKVELQLKGTGCPFLKVLLDVQEV